MKKSIATVTLGGSLTQRLEAAARAGFLQVELFDADLVQDPHKANVIGRVVRDLGMSIASYFPLRDSEGQPASRRGRAFSEAGKHFDIAAELGAGMVMACSSTSPDGLNDDALIVSDLHELGDMAAQRGLRLAYEAIAWGTHVFDYRHAWEIIDKTGNANVGVVLDTFHICAHRFDMTPIARIPAERIFLVQISDAPFLNLDYMNWSRRHRRLPGQGEFPLRDFMAHLHTTGYDGTISLECFDPELQRADADAVAQSGMKSIKQLAKLGQT